MNETDKLKVEMYDDVVKEKNKEYIELTCRFRENCRDIERKDKEIERLNNIINEALGIANERFNYYSNHKNNNEEYLEDWGNIFNILLRRDNK